jgi:hypothetical protein
MANVVYFGIPRLVEFSVGVRTIDKATLDVALPAPCRVASRVIFAIVGPCVGVETMGVAPLGVRFPVFRRSTSECQRRDDRRRDASFVSYNSPTVTFSSF